MPKTTDYRIITATGETHTVTVTPDAQGGYFRLTATGKIGDTFSSQNTIAACVAWYAGKCNWPVAEVVPPGSETRAELADRVRRKALTEARTAISEHAGSYHAYPVGWYEPRALERQLPFQTDGYVSSPGASGSQDGCVIRRTRIMQACASARTPDEALIWVDFLT